LESLNKGKDKITEDITLLILLTGIAGSVSPILPTYTQQITPPKFNIERNSFFLEN